MRIAAAYLPSVRIELARARLRESERGAPLAVVVARPGGAVKDERSLLGGTRLDAVSREARAIGVRPGDTIAAARAKEAALLVRVVAEGDVHGVLASVAEAALAFGRTASIDEARDVVCVDVTGCAHLFEGEPKLAAALRERVRAMHHAARVAVADGPRVATAIARYARRAVAVIEPGRNAEAVAALPVAALPIDARGVAWLAHLGLARVGDLQRLPRRGLATRLGAAHAEVMGLLAGDDGAPLTPYAPPEVLEERAELEYGIEATEPLLFVVKTLCDRLAARLAGRAMAASRVEIELTLDKGVAPGADVVAKPPGKASLAITSPAPLATAGELLAVARARVESWTISAPILAVTMRAPELARKEGRALDLFVPEAKADRALPRLVAELAADLGNDRVGTLALVDTWVPEERTRLVPYGAKRDVPTWRSLESVAPEPSRVVAPAPAEGLAPVRLLARVEAVEWWRRPLGARDFVAAWDAREKRMAWVAIDRDTGASCVRGWMD
jgi:protein ImuB